MGYYSTKVRPLIAAADQHSAFANRDVLFDWTAIQIPRKMGSVKLVSCSAFIRPKGDATPTANNFPFKLYFADDDRTSFGTVDSAQDNRPSRDLLGCLEFSAENKIAMGANTSITSMISGPTLDADHGKFDPLVLSPKEDLDAHTAAYNTIYVGGIAGDAFDFTSINVINDADINSTAVTAVIMAGASMDVREHFAVGDVLHAQDDTLLGTVASIAPFATGPINLTTATSGAGNATTVTNGDTIYNIHPIELVLGFEY